MIEFFVAIEPLPKLRARIGKFGAYTPQKTVQYERQLLLLSRKYRPKVPFDLGLKINLLFFLPKPKRPKFPAYPAGRPDIDNLVKAVFDALNGVFWTDDTRIIQVTARKLWATFQQPMGVDISIEAYT